MNIIVEEVDGAFYADVILTNDELKSLKRNETVNGKVTHRRRMCFVGVRLHGIWDINDNEEDENATAQRKK